MAKVIVDISDEMWNTLQIGQYQMGYAEYVARYVEKGKLIPSNATNGDVIKALFPNAKFDNAMPFTDGRWETINLDTEDKTRAMYKPTQLRTYADWWNALYKAGDTK